MGMDITMTQTKKSPGKQVIEVSGNGMTFNKVIADGKDVEMFQMGQKTPVDEKTKETTLFESGIFKELSYAGLGAKAAVTGIESVDGAECYVVEYTLPSGEKFSEFFDRGSGLKIQALKIVQGPKGLFRSCQNSPDYREVSGFGFPMRLRKARGP